MKTSLITKATILLIGDLPLASEVFKLFWKHKDEVHIIGVLVQHPDKKFVNDPFEEKRNLFEVATSHGVPIYYSVAEVLYRMRQHNIYGRRYFYPLISDFPMYRGLPSAQRDNLPAANRIANQVICLPIYPGLTIEEVMFIVSIINYY